MTAWPKQSACDSFYGNPRGPKGTYNQLWYRENIVRVECPWKLSMGPAPISAITIHRLCADSLRQVLAETWSEIGGSQDEADRLGYSTFSGSFAYRPIRGGTRLSMHAYGCAIDFDAPHNPLGAAKHRFRADDPLIKAFKAQGWTWGGDWKSRPDAMHVQAAVV